MTQIFHFMYIISFEPLNITMRITGWITLGGTARWIITPSPLNVKRGDSLSFFLLNCL